MAGGPIGIGLMAASSIMGAVGEHGQLKAGARVDGENARLAELGGAFEEEGIRRRERALSGDAVAALAGSGAQVGTGSALDLLFQNSVEREYEVLSRRYEAGSEAAGLRQQAAQKRKAAKGALFGGLLRAGAQAVTGISEMKDSARLSAAAKRSRTLPGGQTLPMPANVKAGGYPWGNSPGPFGGW